VSLEHEVFVYPIGESPYRVKGSAYLLHMKYVDELLPGGRAAMFGAISNPTLRAFFEQPFFVSHLVDVFPLVAVGYTCARIQGTSFERFIRLRSRHQAEGDLKLFRKLILKLASAEALASRIPGITASYFDFATAEVLAKGSDSVTAIMHGIPRPIAPWMTYVVEETLRFMLEYNGTEHLRIRSTAEREGQRDNLDLMAIRGTLRWGEATKSQSEPPR
jgi:hypothetical protein